MLLVIQLSILKDDRYPQVHRKRFNTILSKINKILFVGLCPTCPFDASWLNIPIVIKSIKVDYTIVGTSKIFVSLKPCRGQPDYALPNLVEICPAVQKWPKERTNAQKTKYGYIIWLNNLPALKKLFASM